MRSVNKVILVGNLTRDPEMRQTPNGQNVTTFGVATNREWMTKDSERKNSAEFHECVAWAKLAEICEKYLHKGQLVYVEGYLKTRSWDTPEGVKKFKTEIVVKDMIRLEKRAKDDSEEIYVPEEEYHNGEEYPAEEKIAASTPKEEPAPKATPAPVETPAPEEPSNENPIDKDLGL